MLLRVRVCEKTLVTLRGVNKRGREYFERTLSLVVISVIFIFRQRDSKGTIHL